METKTGNRVMKIQMDFSTISLIIFELWVMETENINKDYKPIRLIFNPILLPKFFKPTREY